MASKTTNYNLTKPAQNDYYHVDDFNDNAEIIDGLLKKLFDKTQKLPDDGNISADNVSFDDSTAKLKAETVQGAILALQNLLDDMAAATHKHSADDITRGILPVARGGTGVDSLSALATALGACKIQSGKYVGTHQMTFSLTTGFKPKIVVIEWILPNGASFQNVTLFDSCPTGNVRPTPKFESCSFTDTGVTIVHYDESPSMNSSGVTYHWYAIG